jgi:crotonobetainyl-CoA:carnitine CoA-transferase CaiB-like acyl-CoA transferase
VRSRRYGADVMLVNSPALPNIEAIADTSRGKRSTLCRPAQRRRAGHAGGPAADAHVFVQGYRPGGLADLGFGPEALARGRPGIVCVSLRLRHAGPVGIAAWFRFAGADGHGLQPRRGRSEGDGQPRPMPMQILDEATGYLIAFGAAAALHRQQREGGSWHVQVSLAQTGQWLRSLGRVAGWARSAQARHR